MTKTDAGRIVLVRFPFTDLSASKRRPALVISDAVYFEKHGDLIMLALTSQPQSNSGSQLQHWQEAGLRKATWIKPVIMTVSAQVITEALGTIHRLDNRAVVAVLNAIVSDRFWRG